jgi:regulator of sigma E protease
MHLVLGIVLGLFVLVVLVVLHELGHAIVARRNGVVVEEFGVGFPPRAWSRKLNNGVLFTLNWLPLGGFVKLKGEHDAARGEGTYGQASFWVKTKIMLAGVLTNWVTAAVLFTLLALVGMPKILPNQVTLPFDTRIERSPLVLAQIVGGSPAAQAGLRVNDQITQIGDVKITTSQELSQTTAKLAGQTVDVEYIRDEQPRSVEVTLHSVEQAKNNGFLGVSAGQSELIHSTWSAPIMGVATTGQLTYETVKGVGSIVVKSAGGFFGQFFGSDASRQAARENLTEVGDNVAGPVGILAVLFPAVIDSGLRQIVLLAAIISLTLAVMNMLPIPALDGGRWFTMAGFRLFRKELTKEREENIQMVGFLVMIGLTILVTWSDVGKLF